MGVSFPHLDKFPYAVRNVTLFPMSLVNIYFRIILMWPVSGRKGSL